MFDCSILLLTKNGKPDLEGLLPELFKQRTIGETEVIAVDSGSTDGTVELLETWGVRTEHILPTEFHHARTRNLAASLARGALLIFLSQDAVPASDTWLARMISTFHDPQVGAVYGRQLPKPRSSLERKDVFDTIYGDTRIVKDPAHRNGLGYRFYHFSNVNAAIRRSVWERLHFPEDLRVFEDLGIAKLILDCGWKIVYEPEAAVYHSHRHSTLGLFKRYFDIGYTLKLLNIWDAPGTKKSMLRDLGQILQSKVRRMGDSSTGDSVGKSIGQDVAKSAGLFLGLNQGHLPLALKRRLSAYRVFE